MTFKSLLTPSEFFRRSTWRETSYVAEALRTETVGGALLLFAALGALIMANSGLADTYQSWQAFKIGPESLHLNLSLAAWAADGLLAVFFLVAGIELKREFVAGDLADKRKAALPIVAAGAGVAMPAILYVLTVRSSGADDALRGWAIPTATDIAFALAVLAVINSHLPSALRSFLLTLAVVDDLIAITIIAVFYTDSMQLLPLVLAIIPLALWRWLLRTGKDHPWRRNRFLVLVPGLLAWGLVHASGVHATVAGVLLGLLVPVNKEAEDDPNRHSFAESFEHHLRPFSAGFAVPVFAFFAAGVPVVGGFAGLSESLRDPAASGVVIGLVCGKVIGIFSGTFLFAKFTRAQLDKALGWWDVFGLSLLAGVGFTVSLLIGELAFGAGTPRDDHVRLGILTGSLVSALLAAIVLRARNRHYRAIKAEEERDDDGDGIPDVYQREDEARERSAPTT